MSETIRLKVVQGTDKDRTFEIPPGASLLVGRGDASDTQIKDPAMSRAHFRINHQDGEIVIQDQNSASGTLLNGSPVTTARVKVGDTIRAGDTFLAIHGLAAAAPAGRRNIANLIGTEFGGFQVDSLLAKGSESIVFQAHEIKKDRPAALKVMLPQFIQDPQQQERFVRAMKTMLNVRDPHIVELYAAGKSGGLCYSAMELIEGDNLDKLIERMGVDGLLDWSEVWRCAIHIARALETGYLRDIVHRNVTPTNIIRRRSDKVFKLADFQLAKAMSGALAKQITEPGQLLGELQYLPPERTVDDGLVDSRSDIFGLGATCYALLTGNPPAQGQGLVNLLKSVREQVPEPPSTVAKNINPEFEAIVMKMLAKNPDDRYRKPAELIVALENISKSNRLEADAADWWVG
ncbi:MAG: FHA domain-containing serine/threonine-protein kinase [Planctomycetota bacterium]|nr:FHA domain-containing serine/threonine-protein kinase [Planctomycetota bacterium]